MPFNMLSARPKPLKLYRKLFHDILLFIDDVPDDQLTTISMSSTLNDVYGFSRTSK